MCKHILITDFNYDTDLNIIKEFATRTHDNDGFGAIIRTKKNELMTIKSMSLASFYVDLTSVLLCYEISQVVVHHRTSTNGTGIEYAHPFEYQGNYLTHNGVVTVKGTHEVKTKNDSEALLHHLIKTNYDTETIQGYFSCFVLNELTTTIVVDDIAPIYTDSRIYCSHPLDGLTKIALQKIVIDLNNARVMTPIIVTKSSYGSDKSHLSLGHSYDYKSDYSFNSPDYRAYYDDDNNVNDFFQLITTSEENELFHFRTATDLRLSIKDIGASLGMRLTKKDIKKIMKYFYFERTS